MDLFKYIYNTHIQNKLFLIVDAILLFYCKNRNEGLCWKSAGRAKLLEGKQQCHLDKYLLPAQING